MKKIMLSIMAIGLTAQVFAQVPKTEQLSEVIVYATNYKYLNDVNTMEVASVPIELLERKAASYDVKDSDFYQDDYDLYNVTFFIPEGKILAAYDKDGKLLRTAEKFKNINLPTSVKTAILDRFPEWKTTKDVYLVNYKDGLGANKTYKVKLENGDKTLRVKLNEKGEFL
ncbi:nicotinate-nucleotide adenylyltransferase [Zobellia nedashkovskayae]|uniref:nicotinate-nucleotide adenylyltransferase n=1 Tax=Zobellia nedashkovskayae TaxID=2779510 RepID=UPI00188CE1FE|nr:nicotinate-nucleotide adenylyltransferase [Zobellia nedashkovskayae]